MKIEIEKPVIPRFVADWVEKERTSSPIHKSFPRAVDLVNNDSDWGNWANEVGSRWSRILATAWVRGYGVEEPLYYAKPKGWELIHLEAVKPYWCLEIDDLFISTNGDLDVGEYHTKMTKTEWNELGINDSNADFEEVKE